MKTPEEVAQAILRDWAMTYVHPENRRPDNPQRAINLAISKVAAAIRADRKEVVEECCKDTDERVFFYEHDFYVLSNFSAFRLYWRGLQFYNSEFAYHWEKFPHNYDIQQAIRNAMSAHEAFKIAERHKDSVRPDWKDVRVSIMRAILCAKADQHEYVRRKLLGTGDRELIENSWRDNFWGWGPNRDGQNMLGKLWMEIRTELRTRFAAELGGENG